MMRKFYAAVLVLAVFFAVGIAPIAAAGEVINYPANGTLRKDAWDFPGSLFPDAASGNRVTVNSGKIPGYVYGGAHLTKDITDNSVFIKGGQMVNDVYGGWSDDGYVSGNSVTVTGGRMFNSVYGGGSTNGDATGNSVTVTGGQVDRSVYGGFSDTSNATDNIVTISNDPAFSEGDSTIYGGSSEDIGKDVKKGNMLNIDKYKGSKVKAIYNFEKINFVLPVSASPENPVLDVTLEAALDGAAIAVMGVEAGSALAKGATVKLMTKVTGDPVLKSGTAGGGSKIYTFTLSVSGGVLSAKVDAIADAGMSFEFPNGGGLVNGVITVPGGGTAKAVLPGVSGGAEIEIPNGTVYGTETNTLTLPADLTATLKTSQVTILLQGGSVITWSGTADASGLSVKAPGGSATAVGKIVTGPKGATITPVNKTSYDVKGGSVITIFSDGSYDAERKSSGGCDAGFGLLGLASLAVLTFTRGKRDE